MIVNNVLSFDIEDWFHPEVFDSRFPMEAWGKLESRVQKNTEMILSLLLKKNLKATFFFLGWVAEKYPELVSNVAAEGHEIGSHGYSHTRINRLSLSQFRNELKSSIEILNSITGTKVKGFRAPTFSVMTETLWVLPLLSEFGIMYDSSIYPAYHDRYGIPSAPKSPFVIYKNGKDFVVEFPMSTVKFLKINFPFGGGGYFRLYPLWLSIRLMRLCQKQKRPIIFYAHPWEFDENNPEVELSLVNRYRHYYGINKFLDRLDRITDLFNFTSFERSNLWDMVDSRHIFETEGPLKI